MFASKILRKSIPVTGSRSVTSTEFVVADTPPNPLSFRDADHRGHGALGNLFFGKQQDIKMGDTPSLLYLLRGDSNDPTAPHWGGAYVKTAHGENNWTDDPNSALAEGNRAGAKTVNRSARRLPYRLAATDGLGVDPVR